MRVVVAVDSHWGIGRDGGMLFYLPTDLAYFRRETLGRVLVYGRRTLASFPGGRPLEGRENILLSRDTALRVPGALVCHSLPALWQTLAAYAPGVIDVIGGAEVYRQLLPYCTVALVTKVEADGGASCYFPNLDDAPGWTLESSGTRQEENGLTFRFCRYGNSRPLKIPGNPV